MSQKSLKHLKKQQKRNAWTVVFLNGTACRIHKWHHVRSNGRSLCKTYHIKPYHYHGIEIGVGELSGNVR